MQCYEGELMRAYLRHHAAGLGAPRRIDELALLETLDGRGMETLTELLALDPAELDDLVQGLVDSPQLAA